MELKTIYTVTSFRLSETGINASITFNKDHEIFKGHFPGNPIVPGVVQIQILKDIVERAIGKKVFLNYAKSIKFSNFINPIETNAVEFEVAFEYQTHDVLSIKCIVKTETVVFMKYTGNSILT